LRWTKMILQRAEGNSSKPEIFSPLRKEFTAVEKDNLDFENYKHLQLGCNANPPAEFFVHLEAYGICM